MKLKDKVAVITGVNENIGGSIAEQMAAEGARVVCSDISADNSNLCAQSVERQGGRALAVPCDVTDAEAVRELVERTVSTFGGIDIVVNGAAVDLHKTILEITVEEWRRQIDVILTGTFVVTKYALGWMVSRGRPGSVINLSSTAGHQGQPGNIGFCTAKSALHNFTRSVAMEMATHGIRVNTLTPTATDPKEGTARAESWGRTFHQAHLADMFEAVRLEVPMQELPTPSDYAKAAVFLASDDARMITGIDLAVDAGVLARYWAWSPRQPETWQGGWLEEPEQARTP